MKKFALKTHEGTILLQVNLDGSAIIPGELTVGSIIGGAGATGAIQLYTQIIDTDTVVPAGQNALSVGPIIVADGVTVTISDGSRWVIT